MPLVRILATNGFCKAQAAEPAGNITTPFFYRS